MDETTPTRICRKCGQEKIVSELVPNKHSKFGVERLCKLCDRTTRKALIAKHPEAQKIRSRRHVEKVGKAAIAAYHREYREKNKEKVSEITASYRNRNRDRVNARCERVRRDMTSSYVARIMGMSVRDLPGELIEAKRIQLKIKRYLKNGD